MQDARVYLELVRERGQKGLPLERVYRQLFNRELYLIAYGKLYRNNGCTPSQNPGGLSFVPQGYPSRATPETPPSLE